MPCCAAALASASTSGSDRLGSRAGLRPALRRRGGRPQGLRAWRCAERVPSVADVACRFHPSARCHVGRALVFRATEGSPRSAGASPFAWAQQSLPSLPMAATRRRLGPSAPPGGVLMRVAGWAASDVDTHASPLRDAGNANQDASPLAHALRPDAASGRAGRRGQRVRGRWLQPNRRWPAITIERLGERRARGTRGSDGPGRRVAAGAIVATPRGRGRGGRGPACAHRSCHDHLSGRRTRIAPRAQARMAELQVHPADVRRQSAGRPGRRVPCTADRPAIVPNHGRALHPVLSVSVTTGWLRSPRSPSR
jgi:hypothetical protein